MKFPELHFSKLFLKLGIIRIRKEEHKIMNKSPVRSCMGTRYHVTSNERSLFGSSGQIHYFILFYTLCGNINKITIFNPVSIHVSFL